MNFTKQQAGAMSENEGEVIEEGSSKKKKLWWWIGAIVAIVLVLKFLSGMGFVPLELFPRVGSGYQAVFLTNGQVYFGKLYKDRSQYPVLRDIYYLQVTQPPQPLQPGEVPPANINVVKLGAELHGPNDEMRINRDSILFIEDLKDDSRVVTAIKQLKENAK
jgi:hypothetical protein